MNNQVHYQYQYLLIFYFECLLTLFCLRVLAQFIVLFMPVAWLPEFSQWHSAVLPYPLLLLVQLIIIAGFIRTLSQFRLNTFKALPTRGTWYIRLAYLYIVAMLMRCLLGLTIYSELSWFTQTLPIFFHFVLAGLVLLTGIAHRYQNVGVSR